jgi:hypothetical protein
MGRTLPIRQAESITPHTYVLQRRLARRFRQQTGLTRDRFRKLHRASPL